MFHLTCNPNCYSEPLHEQKDETNGNIEFLQPYPVVAADALLEIGTAIISALLSLDEHLSQTNTSCVTKFCYQSVYCCLIRYFLVRIRIAKCFTNSSSRRFRGEAMLRSAREYTMFAPAQLLRNWRDQRPSNQNDIDSRL
jgi:hypothetical protein